jgi:hypothetical protein
MSAWDAIFWIALTVFGTGLYVLELSKLAGLAMMVVGTIGMAAWFANQGTIPLWLRSKRWVKREHERIIQDRDDPIHSDYMSGTGKYPKVPEYRYKAADRYLTELIRIGLRKPWQRLWPYLIVGGLLGASILVWISR